MDACSYQYHTPTHHCNSTNVKDKSSNIKIIIVLSKVNNLGLVYCLRYASSNIVQIMVKNKNYYLGSQWL